MDETQCPACGGSDTVLGVELMGESCRRCSGTGRVPVPVNLTAIGGLGTQRVVLTSGYMIEPQNPILSPECSTLAGLVAHVAANPEDAAGVAALCDRLIESGSPHTEIPAAVGELVRGFVGRMAAQLDAIARLKMQASRRAIDDHDRCPAYLEFGGQDRP